MNCQTMTTLKRLYTTNIACINKSTILQSPQHLSQILTGAEGITEHALEKTEVEAVFHR